MKAKFTINIIESAKIEEWEKEEAILEIKKMEQTIEKLYNKVVELQKILLQEYLK